MIAMLASSSRESGLMSAHQKKTANRSARSMQIQRKSSCACGGGCARCQAGSESDDTSKLQKKLSIGASNDPLEQEADRVADQIMATSTHSAVSNSAPRIQRFTAHAAEASNNAAPASVDHVLAGSGKPLEASIQHDMGQRFGNDFSAVRVHSGAAAEQSARDVSANAYTVGNNIVFGAGQYTPTTNQGKRLLAHELTHVVQQSAFDPQDTPRLRPQMPMSQGSATLQRQPEAEVGHENAGAKSNEEKINKLDPNEKDAKSFVEGVIWLLSFSGWQYSSGELLSHPERFPNSLRDDLIVMRKWFLEARDRTSKSLNSDPDLQKKLIENYRYYVFTAIVAFEAKDKMPSWELYDINKDVIDSLAGTPPTPKKKPPTLNAMDDQVMPKLRQARCGIVNKGLEFCGNIIARSDGSYRITGPVSGKLNECGQIVKQETPDEKLVGFYHSHPHDTSHVYADGDPNLDLSEFDKDKADESKINYYLVNWKNEVLKYYPKTNPDAVHGIIEHLPKFENLECDKKLR